MTKKEEKVNLVKIIFNKKSSFWLWEKEKNKVINLFLIIIYCITFFSGVFVFSLGYVLNFCFQNLGIVIFIGFLVFCIFWGLLVDINYKILEINCKKYVLINNKKDFIYFKNNPNDFLKLKLKDNSK